MASDKKGVMDAAQHEVNSSAEVSKKPLFKKKSLFNKSRGAKGGIRNKRVKSDGEGSSEEDNVEVKRSDKRVKKAANNFSTSSGGDDGEERAATREALARETMSAGTVFESSKTAVPVRNSGDATHYTEIDTAADRDTRAILEKNVRMNEAGETTDQDGLYRGMAGYKNHIKKSEAQIGANKHTGTQGPIRAPTFLRATCRFDYQPDICKDYKETGFCGFGDSCKFLHDRADYKSGWALEQEFQAREKKKKEREALGEFAEPEDDEEYLVESDDDLPFACVICRQGFRDPVMTNCGHYFCQDCAQDHYKRDTRCAACGKQTQGVFNAAKRLTEKMRRKGMLTTRKEAGGASAGDSGGAAGDGDGSDYEIREDGVELTDSKVVRKKRGTWATAED